ncbi:MAG TPA: FecR domain-containing protein [Steroidobacteraceae bacterium]
MDPTPERPSLNAQILEEAAEWLVELNTGEPSPAALQEFDAWLRRSPEHVRAYLECLPIWEEGARERSGDPDPATLIALGKNADNVVPLAAASVQSTETPSHTRPRRRFLIAAAFALIAFATGGVAWLHLSRAPTYVTEVGEQRSVTLADGSMIELNARSEVRVRYSERERAIDLVAGQAIFKVAKDPSRPFIVNSEGAQVRAIGTQFDVNRRKSGTVITVLEGRVAVVDEATDGGVLEPIVLAAGDQLTVSVTNRAVKPQPTRANLAAATAWTERRLIFDAATLAEVVEEFNRYNARPIVIRDAALETLPITAEFSSPDPAPLLRFLESQPNVQIVTAEDAIQILARP